MLQQVQLPVTSTSLHYNSDNYTTAGALEWVSARCLQPTRPSTDSYTDTSCSHKTNEGWQEQEQTVDWTLKRGLKRCVQCDSQSALECQSSSATHSHAFHATSSSCHYQHHHHHRRHHHHWLRSMRSSAINDATATNWLTDRQRDTWRATMIWEAINLVSDTLWHPEI